jgi:hypothetical protein
MIKGSGRGLVKHGPGHFNILKCPEFSRHESALTGPAKKGRFMGQNA